MATIDDRQSEVIRQEAYGWLVRLTSGSATVADAEALKNWLRRSPAHEQAFSQANALWDGIDLVGRDANLAATAGLRAVARPAAIGRRAVLSGAIAASVAGLLAVRPSLELWPSWSELTSDYRTGTGERKQISVAGGVLELNTRTSLAVQSGEGQGAVKLIAGEVAIAARSGPFAVLAAEGRTVGNAARFNVRLDDQTVCVTCLGGEVWVEYRDRRAKVRDRQQVRYGDRELTEVMTVDPAIVTAWYRGMLVFHNEPLARVIDEVNRYRPGKLILLDRSLGMRPIEASLRLDRIDDVIMLVRDIYGARVTRLPGGIVLLS
jgi:transmembrane sensor